MGHQRWDNDRESGFWSGIGTGCGVELFGIAVAAVAGVAYGPSEGWGWGIAAGAALCAVGLLWLLKRKRR